MKPVDEMTVDEKNQLCEDLLKRLEEMGRRLEQMNPFI